MGRQAAAVPVWLLAELAPTARLAVALTGTPAAAADLVAETLARESGLTAAEPGGDPTAALRGPLTRTYLRSPAGRGVPASDAAGLDALVGPVRAAVVLRDGEHLTTAEIATILDRPVRGVATNLDRPDHAFAITERYAAAPSLREIALRYPDAVGRVRARTRRRRRLVGAAVAAAIGVVAGAVLLPSLAVRLLPPDTREPGEWRFTHRVRPGDGWTLVQRSLTPDREQTVLRMPVMSGDPGHCSVILSRDRPVVAVDPAAETRPVRVGPDRATHVDDPTMDPYVVWEYASAAFAVVSCARLTTPEPLHLQVAEAVAFRGERLALPFTLTALPDGYRIGWISRGTSPTGPGELGLQPADGSAAPSVAIGYGADEPADRCLGPDVRLRLAGAVGRSSLQVCLTASWFTGSSRPRAADSDRAAATERALDTTAERLRLAGDLADPATWFDARELPG